MNDGKIARKTAPDGTLYHAYDAKGNPLCGAKNRSGGTCKRFPVSGKKRCKLHGGNNRAGVDHGRYTHGRYVRRDADLSSLGAAVARHLDNDDHTLRDEIALLRARIGQLFEYADSGTERAVSVALVKRAHDAIARGVDVGDAVALVNGRELLRQAMGRLTAEQETWDEIRAMVGTLKALVGSEMTKERLEMDYLHAKDVAFMMSELQNLILANVPEPERRLAIQAGLRDVMLAPRALLAPTVYINSDEG